MNPKTALHSNFLAHLQPFLSTGIQGIEADGFLTFHFATNSRPKLSDVAATINAEAGPDITHFDTKLGTLTINTARLNKILMSSVEKQAALWSAMKEFVNKTETAGQARPTDPEMEAKTAALDALADAKKQAEKPGPEPI